MGEQGDREIERGGRGVGGRGWERVNMGKYETTDHKSWEIYISMRRKCKCRGDQSKGVQKGGKKKEGMEWMWGQKK